MVDYFYQFNVQAKGKWINRELIEVMADNFVMKPYSYYQMAIEKGVITVRNQIVEKNYILKDGDSIQHLIHYHEPDAIDISIIAHEEDYLVVNKPSGIACHPTGGYNLFSVTKILEKYGNLSCINRLDVVTSGVLILAFKNAGKYHSQMVKGKIEKIYLAKVKGKFHSEINVDHKLEKNKNNTTFISDVGKESSTYFKLLKYQNGYSLIECRPKTGRSHQIRVHLQSIGFPITNDPVYNSVPENFFYTENPENEGLGILKDNSKKWACSKPIEIHDEKKLFTLENCQQIATRAFRNINAFICLHAYKYKFNKNEYTAAPPQWVKTFDFDFEN